MEPKYKVNPLTSELQEYVFEYNGILALRNFTAKVDGERLILHAADDVNFSILEALVSEVEINGVVYDNPTAAQEALTRLTFNQNRPVLLNKSLKDLILGAVQKIPGKQLTTEDFTTKLRTKLEGLQQVDTSGLLPKGTYTGNASSLKADIDKKVDKVAGKGLSSNDYTNEEKRKNEENALKRVANITVTGDVNKIITITFADSTVMQAPFKDNDHIPLADVNMNSLNFNVNTGVLTGVKNDGNEITVTLDGRYALISHNHDERYAPKKHTHSEYAHRTHRHNWDDIDRKPTNIATTENIKTAIEGIQVGGRNYILNSKNERYKEYKGTIEDYIIYQIVGGTLEKNTTYTLTIEYKSEDVRSVDLFFVANDYSQSHFKNIPNTNGDWKRKIFTFTTNDKTPNGYIRIDNNGSELGNVTSKLWTRLVKLEKGNTPTDWTPAPEDFITPEEVMQKITRTGYEVGTDTVIPQAQQNDTVFVKASCTLGLQNIEHLGSLSLIKTFDTGTVTFTCTGKNIIYPFDNTFNGKKGSTAVVSIHNNDCYIRISNV